MCVVLKSQSISSSLKFTRRANNKIAADYRKIHWKLAKSPAFTREFSHILVYSYAYAADLVSTWD